MTRILFPGHGHYAQPEAMTWCEETGVDYVFGLAGAKPLSRKVGDTADAVRTERAIGNEDVVYGFAETRHRAGSWRKERRAVRPDRGHATRPRHPLYHQSDHDLLIPGEAAPLFRDDAAPYSGMMPPPDSEMIAPPITE
jgi:hypothetical protein